MRTFPAVACLTLALTGCSAGEAEAPAAERIRGFCGTCHAVSDPSLLPRSAWRPVIERMAALYDVDGKQELPASIEECVAYYEAAAPESVWPTDGLPEDGWCEPGTVETGVRAVGRPGLAWGEPGPTWRGSDDFDWTALPHHAGPLAAGEVLARLDLDGDGELEILANGPAPDGTGTRLLEIRTGTAGAAGVRVRTLCDADEDGTLIESVAAGDLDGDGDLDLAVAQPGDFRHGDLLWLEQRPGDPLPTFRTHRLDPRTGSNAVRVVDLDGDGTLDVVACFGAQFETVVAFLNRGRGYFEACTLFEAPNADYGCRAIEIADLDADGDLDVALAAGEIGPSPVVQLFHGVYLLENRGAFPFSARLLARLPGAACVAAGDVDGDGDPDLVAAGELPGTVDADSVAGQASLVLIVNDGALAFRPRALERGRFVHPALALANVDDDLELEILVVSGETLERVEPR